MLSISEALQFNEMQERIGRLEEQMARLLAGASQLPERAEPQAMKRVELFRFLKAHGVSAPLTSTKEELQRLAAELRQKEAA